MGVLEVIESWCWLLRCEKLRGFHLVVGHPLEFLFVDPRVYFVLLSWRPTCGDVAHLVSVA